jgi:hypothetical protein
MSSQFYSNDESARGGALDWRAQVSQHPLAFSAGALAAGFVVGYGLAGALSGDQQWSTAEGSNKPGLIEKFKQTEAFDRLQVEAANLGDRLMSELSRMGQEVVLPALTGKIKERFGA